MWWIIFMSIEPSLAPAKQRRAAIAEKAIIGSLMVCAAAIVFEVWH
jgi:hypothetical protein